MYTMAKYLNWLEVLLEQIIVHVKTISGLQAEVAKKKVKKTNIPVSGFVYGGMEAADLQKAVEKEFEMALQDRVMEETKDKKNAVEAYVYDMRNKVGTAWLLYMIIMLPPYWSSKI